MRIAERLRRLDAFVIQNSPRWLGILRGIYRQPSRVVERSPDPLGFIFAWMRTDEATRTAARQDQATNDE